MSENITNRLKIYGNHRVIEKIITKIQGDGKDDFIDFNKIIEMPVELETANYPYKTTTQELSQLYIKDFGFDNWYDWRLKNWGTSQNAYNQTLIRVRNNNIECEYERLEIVFDTYNSIPKNIILRLSEMFRINIELEFSGEKIGEDVGWYNVNNGTIYSEYYFNDDDQYCLESLSLSMEILNCKDYYLNDYLILETQKKLSDFDKTLCMLAYLDDRLNRNYPVRVLEYIKKIALQRKNDKVIERIEDILFVPYN